MKYSALTVLILLFLLSACRNRSTPAPGAAVGFEQLPADFQEFYQKFHSDSAYQMSHIEWPLRGETGVQVDSVTSQRQLAEWQPATWSVQHAVNFNTGEFKGRWEKIGDDFVTEIIQYAAANYGVERRFSKGDDGQWKLIYYADMQDLGQ